MSRRLVEAIHFHYRTSDAELKLIIWMAVFQSKRKG